MNLSEILKKIVTYLLNNRYTVTVNRHIDIVNSMNNDIVTLINAIELLRQQVEIKENLNKKYKEKINKQEVELFQAHRLVDLLKYVRSN